MTAVDPEAPIVTPARRVPPWLLEGAFTSMPKLPDNRSFLFLRRSAWDAD